MGLVSTTESQRESGEMSSRTVVSAGTNFTAGRAPPSKMAPVPTRGEPTWPPPPSTVSIRTWKWSVVSYTPSSKVRMGIWRDFCRGRITKVSDGWST